MCRLNAHCAQRPDILNGTSTGDIIGEGSTVRKWPSPAGIVAMARELLRLE